MLWMIEPTDRHPHHRPPGTDHRPPPIAFTRSPRSKAPSTSAIDDAPSPAPTAPPRTRAKIKIPTFGAAAESTATSDVVAQADEVEAAMPPTVAHLARQRGHHRIGEHRPRHHPRHGWDRRVKTPSDLGQRYDEDCEEDVARQQTAEHHDKKPPAIALASTRRRRWTRSRRSSGHGTTAISSPPPAPNASSSGSPPGPKSGRGRVVQAGWCVWGGVVVRAHSRTRLSVTCAPAAGQLGPLKGTGQAAALLAAALLRRRCCCGLSLRRPPLRRQVTSGGSFSASSETVQRSFL